MLFDDGHAVAAVVELIRHGETRGAGADDGDLLVRSVVGEARLHVAVLERVLDDGALVVVHGHGRVVESAGAGLLAEGGADAAGELREIVGLQKSCDTGEFYQTFREELMPFKNSFKKLQRKEHFQIRTMRPPSH